VDPEAVRAALRERGADLVACVHAETSTGVLNPVRDLTAIAHEHGALVLVDAVTSLGGHPLEAAAWGLDAVYSCTQKCIGAPSGLAPVAWTPAAQARRVPCRSFYLDLALLEDYWVRRKYHHTLSSTLLYALYEALAAVEEEGLEARWARHERNHQALVRGLEALGLSLLPPQSERLWTLNAVRVPDGIDEAAVRRALLTGFGIEIGAGLGPLAGKIWRVGLMGASSTDTLVTQFLDALGQVLQRQR
jgi:alanine-glyoxylate transaminase/serine-glyoxylate transaminase/serine-pyruvate transaminase